MNKKIWALILLMLLVLFMFIAYRSLSSKRVGQTTPGGGKTETREEPGKLVSIKDALTLGKSVQCNYTTEEGEMTTWVKGEKVRVEGVGFDSGGSGEGGMINDGEWVYIWGKEDESGMKYKLSALGEGEWGEEVDIWKDPQKWAAETEDKYAMDCRNVLVTDSKFVPPSDIEFTDLTEMFEKIKGLQEQVPTAQ